MTTLDERHGLVGAREPAAVSLDQPIATQVRIAGSKAANLARAARAGLPVLPGFVIADGVEPEAAAVRRAWQELSEGGARPLVVRSSSPQEDTESSSLAGQFASVLDVRGWADFRTAVRTVRDSARRPDGTVTPMAVLVQPMLTARIGGVMFGADPVEGRADRMLVSAVRGGPDSLVSGEQAGDSYWLSRRGRLLRTEPPDAVALLTRGELVRLARLARRVRRVFGGPQDVEFGFDGDGRLWLFQSRPITAMAVRPPRRARLLGPGPVAETLPGQLLPLEQDLWVTPMARGLAAALDIGGSAPRRLLRTVPVVTTVGGRAAADLRLLGAVAPRHRWLALLNPAPGARRLAAAWRVGRLSAALPGLATDLVADVDRHLAEIPPPTLLTGPDLLAELRWSRAALVPLHAQEALAGALLTDPAKSRTAAGAALTALAESRSRGIPDEQATASEPLLLALTAPGLRAAARLPDGPAARTPEGGRATPVEGAPADTPSRTPTPTPKPGTATLLQSAPIDAPSPTTTPTPKPSTTTPVQSAPADTPSPTPTPTPKPSTTTPVQSAPIDTPSPTPTPTPKPSTATLLQSAPADTPSPTPTPTPKPSTATPAQSGPLDEPRHTVSHTARPGAAAHVGENGVEAPVGEAAIRTAVPARDVAARHRVARKGGAETLRGDAAAAHAPEDGASAADTHRDPGVERPQHKSPISLGHSSRRPAATRVSSGALVAALPPREALRLRVRWVQEVQVRLVRELAWRLGVGVERVGMLRWGEVAAALDGGALPADVRARVPEPESPPLPDAFRLAGGKVVAERTAGGPGHGAFERGDGGVPGRGVSGGRAVGTVWDGSGSPPPDAVLVVRTLDPALAPLLPRLAALVAQTGSPLSHLAVLAREFGLPAVVGAADAVRRFPPGTRVVVDGGTGDVRPEDA
ncbi:PEP/pyruvate-binding domain-containing protein [Streptomyces sp. 7R007]